MDVPLRRLRVDAVPKIDGALDQAFAQLAHIRCTAVRLALAVLELQLHRGVANEGLGFFRGQGQSDRSAPRKRHANGKLTLPKDRLGARTRGAGSALNVASHQPSRLPCVTLLAFRLARPCVVIDYLLLNFN